MLPLFAFRQGPGYVGTMTIGPVTLEWEEWTLVLLVCSVAFTLFSAYLGFRYRRCWWLVFPIALLAALIGYIYRMFRSGHPPHIDFEHSWYVFLVLFPLVVVHAVVSFTMPRRTPSAEPFRRYNSP